MDRPLSSCSLIPLLSSILLLMVPFPLLAGSTLLGELIKGQPPSKTWQLPAQAIDTREIPEVTLDPGAPPNKPLPVYGLTDNTYFLFGNIATLDEKNRGWNGNAGFIVTTEGVVVIDSLGTPKLGSRLIATIRSITSKPIKYLIVTHNHPDHAYGSSAFRQIDGITIIAHKGIIDYNHSATLQASVDYRRTLLPKDMEGFTPLKADIFMDAETFSKKRIRLGEAVFDIYNTGTHHSYGDLIVHQVNERIIWLSDLAFNQRTTYMGDGDSAQILVAEDWLMDSFQDIQLMVPGHGSAQTPPFPMVSKTHDYVTRMRESMRKAVVNDVGLFDAVKNVEFEDWKDTRLYKQNQRANANFVYREMEKAYFENF
jgi:glyoxylase-like metal-dependent hydrolase (beta-lactamase superfamily II)